MAKTNTRRWDHTGPTLLPILLLMLLSGCTPAAETHGRLPALAVSGA